MKHQSGLTPTAQAMQRWRDALDRVNARNLDYAPKLDTPAVLREMGVKRAKLELPTRYLLAIRQKHPDVPLAVFEHLPALLADPLMAYPYPGGGWRVIVNAVSERGAPIAVGVDQDGKIHTVTPIDDKPGGLSGTERITKAFDRAGGKRGARRYSKNEAPAFGKPLAGASLQAAPALIALHRDSRNARNVLTRADLVKKHGADFYQSGTGPRGAFNPETLQISLLKNADPSTFLHESAHYFFEDGIALASQLVHRPTARSGAD